MNSRLLAVSAASALALLASGAAIAQWPLPLNESGKPTLAPLLKRVTPAVVNISVSSRRRVARNPLLDDPFFRKFFNVPDQPYEVPSQAVGSGVIVDIANGYVLTNHHVIENADEIVVTLTDGRRFNAELVGSDEGTDIAVLKIDPDNLTGIELADSADLEVGDFVVAIGNPFGLGQTVTSGIVSALGRRGLSIENYENFIQTDASINPGNSGGALIDLDGHLVGVNTAIVAPSGGNVGIGFAIPSNIARDVMRQLIEHGEFRRGRLGIGIQDVTPDLSRALDIPVTEGTVVTQVEPGSAAERAGLEAGDVIVSVNGERVSNVADLQLKVGLIPVGTTVDVEYLRNGRRQTTKATIDDEDATASANGSVVIDRLDGAELVNLDAQDPRFGSRGGVLVQSVEPGSPADRNGLREGDVILAVNRTPIRSVAELGRVLGAARGAVALDIVRGKGRLFLVIQ